MDAKAEFVTIPIAQFNQILDKLLSPVPGIQNDLLTTKEAAAYLKVSLVSFWRIRRSAEIQSVSVGQKILYKKAALDQYLNREKEVVNG